MKDHAQYAEMLALYAIGALDNTQDCPELEAHLRNCPECRKELAVLRGDAALLALSAVGPAPPQGARQRLAAAISNQPRKPAAVPPRMVIGVLRPRWLTFVPVAASLALAIFSLMLLRANSRLLKKVEYTQAQLADQNEKLRQAQELVAVLHGPDSKDFTLVAIEEPPRPHVKTFYSPKVGRLVLVAGNLKPLPPNKAYELWLLPANGGAPMPAGTFKPNEKGGAMMDHKMSEAGVEAKGFAITVEPESGSTVPTPPIRFMGAG